MALHLPGLLAGLPEAGGLGHCHLQGGQEEAFLYRLYQVAGNADAVGAFDQLTVLEGGQEDYTAAEVLPDDGF